jgi:hypothetical protein
VLDRIGSGIKRFWARQKASWAVTSRRVELRSAEQKVIKILKDLYSRKFPQNRFFASMGEVAEQVERILSLQMRQWSRQQTFVAPDGRVAEHTLINGFTETFLKGSLGSEFEPATMVARMNEGRLAGDGETIRVDVFYEIVLTVRLELNPGGGVDVTSRAVETIDPHRQCVDVVSGHYRAPSRMYRRFGGDPGQQLLEILRTQVRDSRPSFEEWSSSPVARADAEVVRAEAEVVAAKIRLAQAEAALNALP